MEELEDSLIILNEKIKTLQIARIYDNGNIFKVSFKGNPDQYYTYSAKKVRWLKNPVTIEPKYCKVLKDNKIISNIASILEFNNHYHKFWRIKLNNGKEYEYSEAEIEVHISCITTEKTQNILSYLSHVAEINPLRNEYNNNGILSSIYNKLDFIDDKSAAACYLNPSEHNPNHTNSPAPNKISGYSKKPSNHTPNHTNSPAPNKLSGCSNPSEQKNKHLSPKELIFPFGCNASQQKAVATAFENQISVIQGPPGTGKTQTILNIIANIVRAGQTVLIVSNNNSATANVKEKLDKYGFNFIVAPLGNRDNKELFINTQSDIPQEVKSWSLPIENEQKVTDTLKNSLSNLKIVYSLMNEDATLRQELSNITVEWKHFCMDNGIDEQQNLSTSFPNLKRYLQSKKANNSFSHLIISLWLYYLSKADGTAHKPLGFIAKISEFFTALKMGYNLRFKLKLHDKYNPQNLQPLVFELQKLYYIVRKEEIAIRIEKIKAELSHYNATKLTEALTSSSLSLLKSSLCNKYNTQENIYFNNIDNLIQSGDKFFNRYPVVLSTTFSSRNCLFGPRLYDYIIMDEASQVSIETGLLALTCANNAVIVGDTLQLPNVITGEDKTKLGTIKQQYDIPDGYDCAKNSFLESVRTVINSVPETLLQEHYRCHPRIINFCNQKFYGGNLIIMTRDNGEKDVLNAYLTVKGNHAIEHYNQREIDVVHNEILPTLDNCKDLGIITPYNNQVQQFRRQLPDIDTATVHKFQGREKDTIIMSVVDNQITPFADDANMINVAVSRAKNKFCLVMTGNEQVSHGNIMDLLDYIQYNNCTVNNSKIASIFDYLYSQYTAERITLLKKMPHISEYASENLTYNLIEEIIASEQRYSCFKVLCHIPLRHIFKDMSIMSSEERTFASNINAHVDFLIINNISKMPVFAIETDGYAFHNQATKQHNRDVIKNHIFEIYSFPLIRLSTRGSGEKEKIIEQLNKYC